MQAAHLPGWHHQRQALEHAGVGARGVGEHDIPQLNAPLKAGGLQLARVGDLWAGG